MQKKRKERISARLSSKSTGTSSNTNICMTCILSWLNLRKKINTI